MLSFHIIHHVAIIVSDYQKSRSFYVDTLGFEVKAEHYRDDRDDWKLDLSLGDCELEIFGIKNAPARPSYPEACGLRHLAFKVEDVDQAVKELAAKGVSCELVRIDQFNGKKMTFFQDPDGLPLELHE
jgi:Lactoylglutathione lyase and related lyases